MRKLQYIFVLFFALFLLSACADDKEVVALLDRAEALMEASPDSASRLLHAADSTIARQSENTRMRHAVLLAEANNKLYLPLPSDTIFQEVVDYYDRHGTPNQQLRAHYLLGCIYRDRNEAPQALQCYYDAIEKADTLSPDCDYMTLYRIYGQMADIFEDQIMPDEEIEALSQYSKYALKAGNIYEHIHGIELTTLPYDFQRDTTMILSTEKKAHDLYEKYGFTKEATAAYGITIYICIKKGHYEKARQLMQAFENQPDLYDKEGNVIDGRENYYNARGQYYLGIGQLDSAEHEFKRLIPYGYTYNAYRGLLDVSLAQRDLNAAFSYLKLYEAALDTLVTDIHAEATRQALGMYDYTRHQRMAEAKQREAEQNRFMLILLVIIILFTSCIVYMLYRNHRNRQMREMARLNNLYVTTQLHHDRLQIELQGLQLDYSETLSEREKELQALQQKLQAYQRQYERIPPNEKEQSLIESDIVHEFKNMVNPYFHKNVPSRSDWKHLQTLVKQCLPSFYHQIMESSTLTAMEQQVCILTRLSFLPKEISILLQSTPQRISNAKANANKKLFSEENAKLLFSNLKHWC